MATPMLFYKTFKHTDSRLEDMTAYLTEQLKDSTDFTVSMTVMRKGAPHELLKPWDDAEDSNINKIIQNYYIFMLSITNTKYNDDESRQAMMNVYIKRFSIQEVMDVMRCVNHALTTGVIPFEWRAYFSSPKIAKEKVLADINALLSIPENYTAYMEKTPKQVMASPEQVMASPEREAKQAKQVMPEAKQEAKPEAKPVRLRSFGYSIGLNDETSQRVLRKAVESAGLYNVLCKLEFLLRVWDKYPCMRFLERDHAFVKGLLNEM
jgi:hypothetical protein